MNTNDFQIDLVCPLCKNKLEAEINKFSCRKCSKEYPITFGIPDLRISDPFFFTLEKERENVKNLIENFATNSYSDLVKLRFSNEIRKDLLERYLRSWLGTVERNLSLFQRAERICKEIGYSMENRIALDVGAGSGGMLITLASKFKLVVGVDISMESLIYAKKLLLEHNLNNVQLYCCGINFLPFQQDTFDLVSASNVIEHIQDQKTAIQEIHRTQRYNAIFFGDIPNRFSLRPEPHVNLKLVGFLPKKYAPNYVWLFRKRHYEGYNLPSMLDLVKLFKPIYHENYKLIPIGHIFKGLSKLISNIRSLEMIENMHNFFCDYFIVIAKKN